MEQVKLNALNKMKEILYNLALLDTINFCKDTGIDCSGSYLVKCPSMDYTYDLIGQEDKHLIVSVTFHKNQVPAHRVGQRHEAEYLKNETEWQNAFN